MKKRFKSGFTLAEVLITIAVIGVVAAITMPTMISSYQYKTVGVKLSKFAANIESNARAYVSATKSLSTITDVKDFVTDSFLFTSGDTNGELEKNAEGTLKDGTKIKYNEAATTNIDGTKYSSEKYGVPVAVFEFQPEITGLPSTAQQKFQFVVTELGYVFPEKSDTCLDEIMKNKWITVKKDFAPETSGGKKGCYVSGT